MSNDCIIKSPIYRNIKGTLFHVEEWHDWYMIFHKRPSWCIYMPINDTRYLSFSEALTALEIDAKQNKWKEVKA